MTLRNILLILTLTLHISGQSQESTNKRFIINADKIVKGYLNSIFTEQVVNTHVKLNEMKSLVRNDKTYKYFSLKDYRSDYKPTSVTLTYDFLFKGGTVYIISFDVNDSLKIENNEDYMFTDIPQLIGWKNVITNKFDFNYDKLKDYIKSNRDIDTAYKDITIGYKAYPNFIQKGQDYFIETKYYWLITIYSKTRNGDNTYDVIQQNREIRIDANSGKVLLDKLLKEPFSYK